MSRQKLVPYIHTDGKVWEFFFVDPESQKIYFVKSHRGKKIKFSCHVKVPNGTQAKRFANSEFDARTGKKAKHVRTLIKEETPLWLAMKESEGWSYDTMNNIRRGRKQIDEFWGDKLPSEISRDSFGEWCAFWKVNHPDIQMENAVKYLNNFCVYLHEKVVNDRPLLASRLRFKDPNRNQIEAQRDLKKERIFTQEEFNKIHATAANEDDALVVHIMYTMATRINETLELDFDRILLDLEVPLYRWYSGNNKAKKIGQHALHPTLIAPLKRLRDRRRREGTNLLFPQQKDNQKPLREQMIDWDGWRERANLGWHWTPHTFKHTILTMLFNDAKNPQLVVCKLYRTSIQVAIRTYVKVTKESMLAMREAIEVKL